MLGRRKPRTARMCLTPCTDAPQAHRHAPLAVLVCRPPRPVWPRLRVIKLVQPQRKHCAAVRALFAVRRAHSATHKPRTRCRVIGVFPRPPGAWPEQCLVVRRQQVRNVVARQCRPHNVRSFPLTAAVIIIIIAVVVATPRPTALVVAPIAPSVFIATEPVSRARTAAAALMD